MPHNLSLNLNKSRNLKLVALTSEIPRKISNCKYKTTFSGSILIERFLFLEIICGSGKFQ